MLRNKASSVRRIAIATVAAGGLVLAAAAPASAAITGGAGAGTGGDYAGPDITRTCSSTLGGTNPLSAFVNTYSLVIDDTGTYTGTTGSSSNTALYSGPSRVTVNATSGFYFSPTGTHDPNVPGGCLAPEPVPVSATVTGASGSGTVSCTSTSGTMTRAQSAVTIQFTGGCTIKGNVPPATGTASGNATHVLAGTLTPCNDPFTGTRVPACDQAPFPQDGPGSIWVGTYSAAGSS